VLQKLIVLAVLPFSLLAQKFQPPGIVTLPARQNERALAASQATTGVQESVTTIRKQVDEVYVIFTVTDKRGRFVNDLRREDIQVTDDKKPPQAISDFRRETDLPLRVGLIIDESSSVRDRFNFEQDAAIEFLNQIVRPSTDKAFVLGFDTTAEITQDFTDNLGKLARGIRGLRPGGETAMYDAIFYACRDRLRSSAEGPATERRALILISDGEDNQSRVTREEAVEMAQRVGVIVYAISTNISGEKRRGDTILERLAETTGGRVFFPVKLHDVAQAFTQIQDELRSQYVLWYKPADLRSDGRFRAIAIGVESNKKLKVRARKGYFAPK
jgi:Ca-activated chloride channel homolog